MNSAADRDELERRGAAWTAREIAQQPAVWKATGQMLRTAAPAVRAFLAPLLSRHDLRIILTGAGSSSFLGRCLQPLLLGALDRRVEALPTTDLVAGPRQYLQREVPTLLRRFQPIVACVESAQLIDDVHRYCDEHDPDTDEDQTPLWRVRPDDEAGSSVGAAHAGQRMTSR